MSVHTPIDVLFERWVLLNPEVVDVFLKFALEAKKRQRRYGIQAITERVRWEYDIVLERVDAFKINNSFMAPMARLLMDLEPQLAGFFEIRKRKCGGRRY